MIEIIIALLLWTSGLFPYWVELTITILLFIRFSWRTGLTIGKMWDLVNKDDEIQNIEDKKLEEDKK